MFAEVEDVCVVEVEVLAANACEDALDLGGLVEAYAVDFLGVGGDWVVELDDGVVFAVILAQGLGQEVQEAILFGYQVNVFVPLVAEHAAPVCAVGHVVFQEYFNLSSDTPVRDIGQTDHTPSTLVNPAAGNVVVAGHSDFDAVGEGEVDKVGFHVFGEFPLWVTSFAEVAFTEFRADNAFGILWGGIKTGETHALPEGLFGDATAYDAVDLAFKPQTDRFANEGIDGYGVGAEDKAVFYGCSTLAEGDRHFV